MQLKKWFFNTFLETANKNEQVILVESKLPFNEGDFDLSYVGINKVESVTLN